MDFYDLAPATLLTLIATCCWVFGFSLGAAGVVLTKIITPTVPARLQRKYHR